MGLVALMKQLSPDPALLSVFVSHIVLSPLGGNFELWVDPALFSLWLHADLHVLKRQLLLVALFFCFFLLDAVVDQKQTLQGKAAAVLMQDLVQS